MPKDVVCKHCSAVNKHYGFQCSKRPNKSEIKPSKKSFIKPVSDKQAERLKLYREVRNEYMKEHHICEFKYCNKIATDLHHMAGRNGKLLADKKYFKALCREHHIWVELHPLEAKELGLSVSRLDK